eukprot:Phypoly_transcript_02098.p1 GENE.Phypoly_transcript_02098~~Phypoly_transcript_02098.p1  ORF type:complete len:620 (+),score=87.17 Phypoly_transcript_02098:1071-2930(+)
MAASDGKVFVGGLSWNTTDESLRNYFGRFGALSNAVIMRDKTNNNRSRGFGFVSFLDSKSVDKVMGEAHTIDSRKVEIKRAVPRSDWDEEDNEPAHNESTLLRTKIFVGGLSRTTTESEFRSYFEPFGTIKEVQVMADRETGQGKGFGFVLFESEKVVDTILNLQHEIGGKVVELRRAEPKRPFLSSFDSPASAPPRDFKPPARDFNRPRDFGAPPRDFNAPRGPKDFGAPRDFGAPPRDFNAPRGPKDFGPPNKKFGPPKNFGAPPRDFSAPPRDFSAPHRDFNAPKSFNAGRDFQKDNNPRTFRDQGGRGDRGAGLLERPGRGVGSGDRGGRGGRGGALGDRGGRGGGLSDRGGRGGREGGSGDRGGRGGRGGGLLDQGGFGGSRGGRGGGGGDRYQERSDDHYEGGRYRAGHTGFSAGAPPPQHSPPPYQPSGPDAGYAPNYSQPNYPPPSYPPQPSYSQQPPNNYVQSGYPPPQQPNYPPPQQPNYPPPHQPASYPPPPQSGYPQQPNYAPYSNPSAPPPPQPRYTQSQPPDYGYPNGGGGGYGGSGGHSGYGPGPSGPSGSHGVYGEGRGRGFEGGRANGHSASAGGHAGGHNPNSSTLYYKRADRAYHPYKSS